MAPRVFLSYAREDQDLVRKLYEDLQFAGFEPWLDEQDILPGQNWDTMMQRAVRSTDFFIACISQNSVNEVGYFQRELKIGLEYADRYPPERIFLIPVRFDRAVDPSMFPESLSRFDWVDIFEANGLDRLLRALRHESDRRAGLSQEPGAAAADRASQEIASAVFDLSDREWRNFVAQMADYKRRKVSGTPHLFARVEKVLPQVIDSPARPFHKRAEWCEVCQAVAVLAAHNPIGDEDLRLHTWVMQTLIRVFQGAADRAFTARRWQHSLFLYDLCYSAGDRNPVSIERRRQATEELDNLERQKEKLYLLVQRAIQAGSDSAMQEPLDALARLDPEYRDVPRLLKKFKRR